MTSDRAALARQLEPLYAAEAKRRMLSTLVQSAPAKPNLAQREELGSTRDKLAKLAGVSHGTTKTHDTERPHTRPHKVSRGDLVSVGD